MDSNTLYVSWVLPQCCERAVQDHPTPAELALLRAVQLAWRITRNCICLLLEDTKSLCDMLYSNYEWIQTNILSSKWFSWAALNSGLKNSLFTYSALFPSLLKSLILIYFFSCLYITLPGQKIYKNRTWCDLHLVVFPGTWAPIPKLLNICLINVSLNNRCHIQITCVEQDEV